MFNRSTKGWNSVVSGGLVGGGGGGLVGGGGGGLVGGGRVGGGLVAPGPQALHGLGIHWIESMNCCMVVCCCTVIGGCG